MRVKLRPGTHFAPVPQGIYWSRSGRSFLLTAPAGLYLALDSQLDRLVRGTDVDELAAALGENARPVLQRVLDTLLDRDVLLDLDRLTVAPPGAAESARYAEVLSYLEANSADPYRVFARLRASVPAVLGSGPAATVAGRNLTAYGIGSAPGAPGATVAVLVDDADEPLDLGATASRLPASAPIVAVHAGPRVALVGSAGGDLLAFAELARRADAWARIDPDGAAARPLSAVLAGSLAAHAVLGALTHEEKPAGAVTVVFGRDVRTRRLPASDADGADHWVEVEATHEDAADPGDGDRPADVVVDGWSALFARWSGLVHRDRDLDLEQLPMSLATGELVGRPGPVRVAGWGEDRARAGLSFGLAAARRLGAGFGYEGCFAAGPTRAHWLADGALRLLGPSLLTRGTLGDCPKWSAVPAASRTLWSLLEDYFGRAARIRLHHAPTLDWTFAEVRDEAGEVRAAEWGETPHAALKTALGAAVAQAQATDSVRDLLRAAGPGTHRLPEIHGEPLRHLYARLESAASARGLRLNARRLVRDRATGTLPLFCGPMTLVGASSAPVGGAAVSPGHASGLVGGAAARPGGASGPLGGSVTT